MFRVYILAMITSEKYTILDYIPQNQNIITDLCILNFNITANINRVKDLIDNNPHTTFWCSTTDFSKKYIQAAADLGIENVVQIPIKTEIIKNFFEKDIKTQEIEEAEQIYQPLTNSKIMIVDDNDLNIKLLYDILINLGIEITTCNNPNDCIKIVKEKKYDLFLLDILMPEMSGFKLAEMIKTTETNCTTPIIFISAISGTENILNGYNLGACSYIEKPFHPNIVKAQIYNLLKIEEEKKKEEQTKESFIATLTHDLKSPINAEINALKLLLNEKQNTNYEKEEMLSELLNSAKYMKLITDKILCHYKQKNSKIKLSKEKTSFNSVIISSIEETKFLTNDKNITTRFYSNIKEDDVYIDIFEIKRVINNLLSNAIEYSSQNSFIDVSLDKNNKEYICNIKDYGLGIDLKKYNCIFDEYLTLSKENKKVGFGLGLNICKKIISAHGGNISIDSLPNKGTTVCFTIPI